MRLNRKKADGIRCLCAGMMMFAATLGGNANAAEILITDLKPGESVLELFNPETGAFEKEMAKTSLSFPITVKKDLGGMFLIELRGKLYSVGSTFVNSTKEYRVTAHCDNRVHAKAVASSRGIGGEGCE